MMKPTHTTLNKYSYGAPQEPKTFAGYGDSILGAWLRQGLTDTTGRTNFEPYAYRPETFCGDRFKFETFTLDHSERALRAAYQQRYGAQQKAGAALIGNYKRFLPEQCGRALDRAIFHAISRNKDHQNVQRESRLRWMESFPAADGLYSADAKALHVHNRALAPELLSEWQDIKRFIFEMETVDYVLQPKLYGGFIEWLGQQPYAQRAWHQQILAQHLKRYQECMESYLAYEKKGAQGAYVSNPKRKKLEELAYTAYKQLHEVFIAVLRKAGHPAADFLSTPLTLLWSKQAYEIGLGPNHMLGLEPILNITARLYEAVEAAVAGRITAAELDRIAASEWGLNILSHLYSDFLFAAPAEFPLNTYAEPMPEAVAMGLSRLNRGTHKDKGAYITHMTHEGLADYPAAAAAMAVFGLAPAAIVAEKLFLAATRAPKALRPVIRNFARLAWVAARYLGQRGGPVVNRNPKDKDIARWQYQQGLGNVFARAQSSVIYTGGTRSLGFPLRSPFADLEVPGVFHLFGDFAPTRDMATTSFEAAQELGIDILVLATEMNNAGPDLPRTWGQLAGQDSMLCYARLQRFAGSIAIAGVMPAASLLTKDDFPGASDEALGELNAAVLRMMESMTGYTLGTGIYSNTI